MNLKDLFSTYTQVDPVLMSITMPELSNNDIYHNLDRALLIVNLPTISLPTINLQSPEAIQNNDLVGLVKNYPTTNNSNNSVTNTSDNSNNKTSKKAEVKASNLKAYGEDKIKYWADKFAKLGFTKQQQIAVVSSMIQECGLKPKGSVEKKELSGSGNTKKGWAHAGEGGVGFTHWSLKSRLIKLYNEHPLRKGPKLAESEAEYAKTNSRHIADLEDDDQALMVAIFYKNLLNKTLSLNLLDTIAEFYMEKAGRGFGANVKGSSYDKALYTGKVYLNSHRKLGYIRASKTNGFLKALADAEGVSQKLGVSTV